MNVYDGKHWNIYDILPYQRNFNFINGSRSTGKTYTLQLFLLDRAINKGESFGYIVRTKTEKDEGIIEEAFKKVMSNEFAGYEITLDKGNLEFENRIIGYCLPLSQSRKLKQRSYPDIYWLMFDEYQIEVSSTDTYIRGWKEPDIFLQLYHTIDRDEDRVKCFFLGNNIKMYNPYHIHPSFNIPVVEKGKIWTSDNVLFQYAEPSKELLTEWENVKFRNIIKNTEYGSMASEGNYTDDNYSFIKGLTGQANYICTLKYSKKEYGVYSDTDGVYIHDKTDPSCKLIYALSLADHAEGTLYSGKGTSSILKWICTQFKKGRLHYTSMTVKTEVEEAIYSIL